MRMEAPWSQKKVQRLTGCMAALIRFISRLGEKGLPFYKFLKKVDVTEPPKSLCPPTVVLVQQTSDNPAGVPKSLTSSVSAFFTFPKSVSPITQTLQYIRGMKMRKQLQ
jgi:hypothetical protein